MCSAERVGHQCTMFRCVLDGCFDFYSCTFPFSKAFPCQHHHCFLPAETEPSPSFYVRLYIAIDVTLTGAKAFKTEEEARRANPNNPNSRMEQEEAQAHAEIETETGEGCHEISTSGPDDSHGDVGDGDGDLDGYDPARDEQVPQEQTTPSFVPSLS